MASDTQVRGDVEHALRIATWRKEPVPRSRPLFTPEAEPQSPEDAEGNILEDDFVFHGFASEGCAVALSAARWRRPDGTWKYRASAHAPQGLYTWVDAELPTEMAERAYEIAAAWVTAYGNAPPRRG